MLSGTQNLYEAAENNDVATINKILKKNKKSLNFQNENGLTPLHVAVIYGKYDAALALIKAGADVNITDSNGNYPILYAFDDNIKELLEKNGAILQDPLFQEIHQAAFSGDINTLKSIIATDPKKIDIQDSNGFTPLMWATMGQQLVAVKLLKAKGADLHLPDDAGYTAVFHAATVKNKALLDFLVKNGALLDDLTNEQSNIVQIAKIEKKDAGFSAHLKNKIALPEKTLEALTSEFKAILERELRAASTTGKKLLVILGETHYVYKIMQLQKCFYQAAKELGINILLVEQRKELDLEYPSDLYAKNELGMNVVRIDNYVQNDASEEPFVDERNEVMVKEIHQINQDAVLRTGSAHVSGLLQKEQTKINFDQYHVVPFNLSSLPVMSKVVEDETTHFVGNPKRVIQVSQAGLSDSKMVIPYWNKPVIEKLSTQVNAIEPTYTPLKEKRKLAKIKEEEKNKNKLTRPLKRKRQLHS